MGSIKVKIHPLFIVLGVLYAFTGKIGLFLICTVSALLHEFGHSVVAGSMGYALNKITLTPFGAVASGNVDGLKKADELKIALAGPFVNVTMGIFCVALWWCFPIVYAFTDVIAEANFTMAIINLIPVYPLDGGRVVSAILSMYFGVDKSHCICKVLGVIFSVVVLSLFVITCFSNPNISILFFAVFAFLGTLDVKKENGYIKLSCDSYVHKLKKGVLVKKIAVDKSVTVKKLLTLIKHDCLNEIEVYDNGKKIALINQEELKDVILTLSLYSSIGEYFNKNDRF